MRGMPNRVLGWEGSYNVRDLGGYRTETGQETRWRRIFRADTLARLTERGRGELLDAGIRTVIDLRTSGELEVGRPPFATHPDVAFHHLPIIDALDRTPEETPETLEEDYLAMLTDAASRFGRVVAAIADAPPGGVLFHCYGGKDRTGLVAALLLRLAGVPISDVAEDYGLTENLLREPTLQWLESGPGERSDREREFRRTVPRPAVMSAVLESVEEWGGVETYLSGAGVSSGQMVRLRDRLLLPAAED